MFDLGWDEMAVIAVVALVVLGPKELPNALRTVTGLMRQARKLAGEFQNGVHQIIREAELEDAKKAIAELNKGSISDAIEKHIDADGEIKTALKTPTDEPATPTATTETATTDKPAAEIAGPVAPAVETSAAETSATESSGHQAEVNPAVAAFAPGGSATHLPEIDEVTPAVDGDLRDTPVEVSHDEELRRASAATLAAEGDEAIKKIKPDQEVSKTS
jgi:sec-independent protein translocase protein TatB